MEELRFSDKQLVDDLAIELMAMGEEGIIRECLYSAFERDEVIYLLDALEWARKKVENED
jgi:hypothetical protein